MKRGIDSQAVREQQVEERILVPRAKPLQKEELELIDIHRTLAQHWHNSATAEAGYDVLKLGLPTFHTGLTTTVTHDEVDPNILYHKLLKIIEPNLFPDEILQEEYLNPSQTDHGTAYSTDVKHTINKIDEVMKREANYEESNDQRSEGNKRDTEMDLDLLQFQDQDDHLVGDYHYTFCDEDDIL
ncbi:hypothetical protein BgAZ_110670 [Babesia gibsoni]|uniref:Uncharacterized protein n=1 Tax=Babesia gibsoni TaxID=33632 RepID=A0AAD8PH00_BABGI|nr:hypothetical protein BgAZ_110670 [Babesia gibsoni]